MKLPKSAKIFLLIFIAVIVTTEAGLFDINYFHSWSNHKFTSGWSSSSITETDSITNIHTHLKTGGFNELPILVLCDGDTLLYKNGTGSSLVLTIRNLHTSFLWIPLFKPATYTARIDCFYNGELRKYNGINFKRIRSNISGNHQATGNILIIGLSSYTNSIRMIKMGIAKSVFNSAKEYLVSLDNGKYELYGLIQH
ncbi:MAG: hypothetical protein V4717_14585 [Bacteroidota bacterium]